jgi:hypothetical protein
MAELLDALDAFSMPLKVGWVVWLAWGIGQIFWYRRERKSPVAAKQVAAPVRRPFLSRPSTPQRSSTRLVTPDPMVARAPAPVAPAPSSPPRLQPAVVEHPPAPPEISEQVSELDKFVADFEMNTRHRHGEPLNGKSSSFGEHPQHTR